VRLAPVPYVLKQRQGEPGVRNRTQQRRIVTVSLETMTIVDALPDLDIRADT
jgi:hypothetical protein